MNHFTMLEIFIRRYFEVKVSQRVAEIFTIDVGASPEERISKKNMQRKATKGWRKFLPALQTRDVEMLVVEDQCNASFRMIHVVLRGEACCGHFCVCSSVSSAAVYGKNENNFMLKNASSFNINAIKFKLQFTLANLTRRRQWSSHHYQRRYRSSLHSF